MSGKQWRCFFCDEVFKRFKDAAEHFGCDDACEADAPACKIAAHEGHLITYIRKLENELRRHVNEDSAVMRSIRTLEREQEGKLREAEERGYAKGVQDMKENGYCAEPSVHACAKAIRSLSPSASPVASTPAEPNPPGSGPVAQSFPQPNRNRIGQQPCGECHIQPGETCDICGAAEPFAWRNKPPIASEPWTITTDREMVQMRKADGRLVEPLYAAPLPSPSVTDEMIEAACKSMTDGVLGVNFDEWAEDARQSYRPHMRAAIEAALRARATATGGGGNG